MYTLKYMDLKKINPWLLKKKKKFDKNQNKMQ